MGRLGQLPAAALPPFTPRPDRARPVAMLRFIARGLGAAVLLSAVATACGGSQQKPDVPENHKVCKYCCTTANIECSCVVLEVVECPEPDNTGILPACAECRSCTKAIAPEESCKQ